MVYKDRIVEKEVRIPKQKIINIPRGRVIENNVPR